MTASPLARRLRLSRFTSKCTPALPQTWADAGASVVWTRAKARVDHIMAAHHPAYLSGQQDAEIRAAFTILG